MNPGERLKRLREALSLTQDRLAEASQRADPESKLTRVDVVSVETHRNKATSNRIRKGIAAGIGASIDDASDYLDGLMDLPELLKRIEYKRKSSGVITVPLVRLLKDRPEWEAAMEEAKRIYRTVPERYFEEAGNFADHVPGALDAYFVGDFARMLHEHAVRTGSA